MRNREESCFVARVCALKGQTVGRQLEVEKKWSRGMRDVKKILVPVDFCGESAGALKHALALASESRAEVMALHVIDKYSPRSLLSKLAGFKIRRH